MFRHEFLHNKFGHDRFLQLYDGTRKTELVRTFNMSETEAVTILSTLKNKKFDLEDLVPFEKAILDKNYVIVYGVEIFDGEKFIQIFEPWEYILRVDMRLSDKLIEKFVEDGFDVAEEYENLTEEDLMELGLKKGHLNRWKKMFEKKRETEKESVSSENQHDEYAEKVVEHSNSARQLVSDVEHEKLIEVLQSQIQTLTLENESSEKEIESLQSELNEVNLQLTSMSGMEADFVKQTKFCETLQFQTNELAEHIKNLTPKAAEAKNLQIEVEELKKLLSQKEEALENMKKYETTKEKKLEREKRELESKLFITEQDFAQFKSEAGAPQKLEYCENCETLDKENLYLNREVQKLKERAEKRMEKIVNLEKTVETYQCKIFDLEEQCQQTKTRMNDLEIQKTQFEALQTLTPKDHEKVLRIFDDNHDQKKKKRNRRLKRNKNFFDPTKNNTKMNTIQRSPPVVNSNRNESKSSHRVRIDTSLPIENEPSIENNVYQNKSQIKLNIHPPYSPKIQSIRIPKNSEERQKAADDAKERRQNLIDSFTKKKPAPSSSAQRQNFRLEVTQPMQSEERPEIVHDPSAWFENDVDDTTTDDDFQPGSTRSQSVNTMDDVTKKDPSRISIEDVGGVPQPIHKKRDPNDKDERLLRLRGICSEESATTIIRSNEIPKKKKGHRRTPSAPGRSRSLYNKRASRSLNPMDRDDSIERGGNQRKTLRSASQKRQYSTPHVRKEKRSKKYSRSVSVPRRSFLDETLNLPQPVMEYLFDNDKEGLKGLQHMGVPFPRIVNQCLFFGDTWRSYLTTVQPKFRMPDAEWTISIFFQASQANLFDLHEPMTIFSQGSLKKSLSIWIQKSNQTNANVIVCCIPGTHANSILKLPLGTNMRDEHQWHHCVVKMRNRSRLCLLQIDEQTNKFNISRQEPRNKWKGSAQPICIGSSQRVPRKNDMGNFFHGHLSALQIFDRAITPSEVNQIQELGFQHIASRQMGVFTGDQEI